MFLKHEQALFDVFGLWGDGGGKVPGVHLAPLLFEVGIPVEELRGGKLGKVLR